MTYNDAYKIHEFCDASDINVVFCGSQEESPDIDLFKGNDSLGVRIAGFAKTIWYTATFMEWEPALAYAQCLFNMEILCETG